VTGTTNAAAFSCNTYSYIRSHGAEACLLHLAGMGFREFELMVYPGHLWPDELSPQARRALRRLMATHGLRLVTLNMPNIDINVAGAAPQMRAYSLDMLTQAVQLAGDLGASGLIIGPGKANPLFPPQPEELVGHFYAALDRLCPIARDCGTALWAENMPFAFLPTIDGLMAALETYGNDAVRIVYDAANAHFIGEDVVAGLRRCRDRLALVHLSDTGQKDFRHDAVGTGTVPFGDVRRALGEIGHAGRPMIEVISHDADQDILASAERLAAMGFGSAR
jgi:sugar phosphate isomerase/epimerase